jgi:hypothetical protein
MMKLRLRPEDRDSIDNHARQLGIRFADCARCGEHRSVQGNYGGQELCPACAQAPRECHACHQVRDMGLITEKWELCFPCWRQELARAARGQNRRTGA